MRSLLMSVTAAFLIAVGSNAWAASTEADFAAAYAAAEAANKQAGVLRNQWTTTVAALAAAKKAAADGNFDSAVAAAKEAEALATASIFQTTEQREAWKELEIR